MVPAQPSDSTQDTLDITSFMRDDFIDDEGSGDDMVSLLEENARLRKLVVRLSEIVCLAARTSCSRAAPGSPMTQLGSVSTLAATAVSFP